jgi:hypothetical protein
MLVVWRPHTSAAAPISDNRSPVLSSLQSFFYQSTSNFIVFCTFNTHTTLFISRKLAQMLKASDVYWGGGTVFGSRSVHALIYSRVLFWHCLNLKMDALWVLPPETSGTTCPTTEHRCQEQDRRCTVYSHAPHNDASIRDGPRTTTVVPKDYNIIL